MYIITGRAPPLHAPICGSHHLVREADRCLDFFDLGDHNLADLSECLDVGAAACDPNPARLNHSHLKPRIRAQHRSANANQHPVSITAGRTSHSRRQTPPKIPTKNNNTRHRMRAKASKTKSGEKRRNGSPHPVVHLDYHVGVGLCAQKKTEKKRKRGKEAMGTPTPTSRETGAGKCETGWVDGEVGVGVGWLARGGG